MDGSQMSNLANSISAFEYTTVLISIILGLGITQILTSISEVIQDYSKVKIYWPHVIWIIFILFLHIQDWFILYQLKFLPYWSLPSIIFILLYPIVLFISARIIMPEKGDEFVHDLRSFYFKRFKFFYYLFSICIVLSILFNILYLNDTIFNQILLISFFIITVCIAYFNIKTEWLHKLLAVLIIVSTIVSVIYEKNMWTIK